MTIASDSMMNTVSNNNEKSTISVDMDNRRDENIVGTSSSYNTSDTVKAFGSMGTTKALNANTANTANTANIIERKKIENIPESVNVIYQNNLRKSKALRTDIDNIDKKYNFKNDTINDCTLFSWKYIKENILPLVTHKQKKIDVAENEIVVNAYCEKRDKERKLSRIKRQTRLLKRKYNFNKD